MDKQTDFLMNISVLYRSTQKYYDRMLQSINLTYAQLPILIMIYEKEGISMREIAESGVYDKGTISKNVKHLEQQGFIHIETNKKDKRNKELYTSDFAKQNMSKIYSVRRDWWQYLIRNIDQSTFDQFIGSYDLLAKNARKFEEFNVVDLLFFDWKKVSLTNYPNHISTVFYTAGNNFRSPFDRHPELLFIKEGLAEIPKNSILDYLEHRQNRIEAVCIEGGEPFMNEHLEEFLSYCKELGYLTKVKTNGTYPDFMKDLVSKNLIDYIELEIMNSPKMYAKSIGMAQFQTDQIDQTLSCLKQEKIDYHCSIHLVREFHTLKSIESMANWLDGIGKMIVYTDIESEDTVQKSLHNVDEKTLSQMVHILQSHCKEIEVRGSSC